MCRKLNASMTHQVKEISIPAGCSLHARAQTASFADAFSTLVPRSDLTATELFVAIGRQTPAWINSLMNLRNSIVRQLGLKDLGTLAALPHTLVEPLQPGQRVGIFTFVRSTPDELVVQDDDKHLTVQLALLKRNIDTEHDEITLCTVVHTHNTLGSLYMLPVGPAHKRIVPTVLRQAPAAVAQACSVV
jgi:hypothetical protein